MKIHYFRWDEVVCFLISWKDLLTSYGDLTYTYDEIGNVISENKGGYTYTTYYNWGKGRQLENISYGISAESANVVVAYEYNSDGIRISKTFSEGGLEFIVDSNKIPI